MRVSIGITSAASTSNPVGYILDPVNYETSWEVLSVPAGWTVDTVAPNGVTYSATGTYISATRDSLDISKAITSRPIGAYTQIIDYKIDATNNDDFYTSGVSNTLPWAYTEQFSLSDSGSNRPVIKFYVNFIDKIVTEMTGVAPMTAYHVISAVTVDESGVATAYLFTAEGYVIKTIGTCDVPFNGFSDTIDQFNIFAERIAGTRADFKLAHTYFGIDEALSESAIKSKITGWGWTEATLTPSAAEQTDADWTALALPATWNVNPDYSGTVTYGAGGAVNSSVDDAVLYQDTAKTYCQSMTAILAVDTTITDVIPCDLIVGERAGIDMTFVSDLTNVTPSISLGAYLTNPFSTVAVGTSGIMMLAATVDTAGDYSYYFFENGEAVTVVSGTGIHLPNTYVADAFVFLSALGDSKLVNTYVGFDEVLDQTAITAIVSGWGWTP